MVKFRLCNLKIMGSNCENNNSACGDSSHIPQWRESRALGCPYSLLQDMRDGWWSEQNLNTHITNRCRNWLPSEKQSHEIHLSFLASKRPVKKDNQYSKILVIIWISTKNFFKKRIRKKKRRVLLGGILLSHYTFKALVCISTFFPPIVMLSGSTIAFISSRVAVSEDTSSFLSTISNVVKSDKR